MRFFTTVVAALAVFARVFAAPSTQLKPVYTSGGETKADSYIVKLKDHVSKSAHLGWLSTHHGTSANITHPEWWSDVLHGYAGILGNDALYALRASQDVDYIETDGFVHTTAVQTGAPWGLQRISQRARLPPNSNANAPTFNYTFTGTGSGVDVYVVDTGIYTAHSAFGGRARWGTTFGGYASQDGNGHGTHCAGTVGSSLYGVAKDVSLIAVKVLSDSGSGYYSDVISGINYVANQTIASGRPSVLSMSLGGGAYQAVDDAVNGASAKGVTVVVAAGNSNTDAGSTSPARAASAIAVGASDINDARAYFSNYGQVVKLFAPGLNVESAWIGSPTATNIISGTSMSTPHVAGLAATILGASSSRMTPSQVLQQILNMSTKGALSNIPAGTVNNLAYNGATGA